MSDIELENLLIEKTFCERKLTLEIIELLEELDRRKLFLERGYSSLHEYCVKVLKYSDSSAYRRISAMKVVRDVPETREAIICGTLNLSTVAQAHNFCRRETVATKREVLREIEGKTSRETERILAEKLPDMPTREHARAIAGQKTRVTVDLPCDVVEKLNEIKNLLSHKMKDSSYAEAIRLMADITLAKIRPTQSFTDTVKQDVKRSVSTTRYIPASVKRIVWHKSNGQCCYHDPKTGTRCSAKRYLHYDHKKPFAHGGLTSADNMQLLCASHNLFKGTS